MALYNELNRQVQSSDVQLLSGCELRDNPMANLLPEAPISQWASGFIQGYDWLADMWNDYVPEDLDEDFGSQMLVLSFFANTDIAKAFVEDSTKPDTTVESMSIFIHSVFIGAMKDFALLGYAIQQAILGENLSPAQPVRSEKIGRNAACPCGSGKKYKRCCSIAQ